MRQKKEGLSQTQRLGLVWFSVGLLIVAVLAIFLPGRAAKEPEKPTAGVVDTAILGTNGNQRGSYRRNDKPHSGLAATGNTASRPRPEPAAAPPVVRKQPLVVELNDADSLTLQLLRGIGPARARAIVRYRERLGGFVDVRQLEEVWGIDSVLVDGLSPMLRVDTAGIKRLRVNTAGLKELARHPYMEYYPARDIVRLRQGGFRFGSEDDLRAVPSMADSTLRRLAPYLDYTDTAVSTTRCE